MDIYRQLITVPHKHPAARDVGALHQLIESGYDYDAPTEGVNRSLNKGLFRANRIAPPRAAGIYPPHAGRAHTVLVQGASVGDWPELTVSKPAKVRYDFAAGDTVEIEAALNPMKSVCAAEPGERGKKIVMTDIHEIAQWVRSRMSESGLEIAPEDIIVRSPERVLGTRSKRHGKAPFHVDMRAVNAVGTVTDADALTERLIDGLGRARAYGAGLILHRKLH